jgi:hypothetical protein
MEVHVLELHLTDADLQTLVQKHLPSDLPVEDLRIYFTAEGVQVRGTYPLLVNVGFECAWQVEVAQGKLRGKLARMKALGMPAMVFKSAVMKALEVFAKDEYWLAVEGEHVVIDPEYLLSRYALPGRLNLRSIRFQDTEAFISAGR